MQKPLTNAFRVLALLALAIIASSLTWMGLRSSHNLGGTGPRAEKARVAPAAPATNLAEANKQQIRATYARLPLAFEANQGQVDSEVKFLSRGNGYTLFLTSTEAVLSLAAPALEPGSGPQNSSSTSGLAPNLKQKHPGHGHAGEAKASNTVVRMKLVGANPAAEVSGDGMLPGTSNYFVGTDRNHWRSNVPNYAQVRYREVYPGIDLVYYGNQQQLEYDFVVAPGADPNAIMLDFEGTEKLSADANGDLVLAAKGGDLRLQKPIVYQEENGEKRLIEGRYFLDEKQHKVGFTVASYDRSKTLVIDPILSYSTYVNDAGFAAIAVDSSGNAYLTGSNYPSSFVMKLNAAGTALVYSTYLGCGDLFDPAPDVYCRSETIAYSIAVDSSGNAYVTGYVNCNDPPFCNDFPTTPGAFDTAQPDGQQEQKAFVSNLNPTGDTLLYSTFLGSGPLQSFGIAVDASGNAYVTGHEIRNLDPYRTGAFVTKLNVAGSALVYSAPLGGSGTNSSAITVDSSGNAYVTGSTNESDFPTVNAFQATLGVRQPCHPYDFQNVSNAFVTKLNSAGTGLIYSTYLGGSGGMCGTYGANGGDRGVGIAVDALGNAYVAGMTSSSDFPTTPGAFQTALLGQGDAFVTKLNATGNALIYSTYLGGSGLDWRGFEWVTGIAVDSSGAACVVGYTPSLDFPNVNAIQSIPKSGDLFNGFISKLTAAGDGLTFSTYLSGSGGSGIAGIALDSLGNAYVAGGTDSTDFPTTAGAYQTTNLGLGNTGFVAKIGFNVTPSGKPVPVPTPPHASPPPKKTK